MAQNALRCGMGVSAGAGNDSRCGLVRDVKEGFEPVVNDGLFELVHLAVGGCDLHEDDRRGERKLGLVLLDSLALLQ